MKKYLIIILFCFYRFLFSQNFTENDWHTAFNEKVTHGNIESRTPLGRIDILTDDYAIEVDYVRNFRNGIRQALQYASETGKKPGIALIIDGPGDSFIDLVKAKILSNEDHVKFWLINEFVTIEELISRKNVSIRNDTPPIHGIYENIFPEQTDGNNNQKPAIRPRPQNVIPQMQSNEYWLNTKTGVRHNRSCRWYGNTINGRSCSLEEGRPCGQCGG